MYNCTTRVFTAAYYNRELIEGSNKSDTYMTKLQDLLGDKKATMSVQLGERVSIQNTYSSFEVNVTVTLTCGQEEKLLKAAGLEAERHAAHMLDEYSNDMEQIVKAHLDRVNVQGQ